MSKILTIVESPGKIKKIQSILGSKYNVVASVGHIIDLDPKKLSVDVENNFKPTYVTIQGKNKVIKDLKECASKSSRILLATDEDREGEMIAWSLAYVLNIKEPERIVFNSITKNELLESVKKPTKIDYNMVDAQKARRILDRIVGFQGSKVLFNHLGKGKLSAGRVQSVVTRLIIDKEEEIKKSLEKGHKSYFKITGSFEDNNKESMKAILHDLKTKTDNEFGKEYKGSQTKFEKDEECRDFLNKCMISKFTIENIFSKESIRKPGTPFTTSTLQQEANRKLGFTGKRTMMAAQRLYEAGYITYMRTDSISLSDEAMTKIKNFIIQNYGIDYYNKTDYKTKNKNTQEAHEAIRPTHMETKDVPQSQKIGNDEIRLYSLIWKRTISSQMKPARYDIMSIQIA